jgi:TonB-linked SusC/RagA family outer membrane protein
MKKNRKACYPIRDSMLKILRVMRIVTLLMLVGLLQVSANIFSQNANIKLEVKSLSLREVIQKIENQSELVFFYSPMDVEGIQVSDIALERATLEKALDVCLSGSNLVYEIKHKDVILRREQKIAGNDEPRVEEADQGNRAAGTVKSQDGEPIPGVAIVIKGTTKGTITDFDGNFTLNGVAEGDVLVFSFVGMKSHEFVYRGQSEISVVMSEKTQGLEEVVVVGYGNQNKATVTGAISSVNTKELLQSPQANVSNALVGRLSGLLAVQRSGEPGADESTLRIRGVGTFTGNADPLIMVDGIESDNYNNIDPNEIEDITILKDASATAVYGVRGANGVLLITTKRGTTGKPQFSLTSSVAGSQFTDLRQSLDAYDFSRFYNEAEKYDSYLTGSYVERYTEEDIEKYRTGSDPVFHPNSNWQDLLLKKTAMQHQHNLNIRGGTDRVKYFTSVGFFSQEGLFRTDNLTHDFDPQIRYKRYNFRSNLDFEVTKRLKISVNISSEIEERSGAEASTRGVLDNIMRNNPIHSPGLYEGKITHIEGLSHQNPFQSLLQGGYSRNYENYLKGTVRLNYDLDFILDGLKSHATLSYQNYFSHKSVYRKNILSYNAVQLEDGSAVFIPEGQDAPFGFSESGDKNRRAYTELGIDYSKAFGVHNVTAMVLYKQSKYYSPELAFLVPNGYQGLAARVTYDYQKRYLAEFSVGYEGTENFAVGKRFGWFPAVSLGWVVSEESFFPENNIVSFLKIRATSGEVGNDKVGEITEDDSRFLYRPSSYSYDGGYHWGEVGNNLNYYGGAYEGKIGNPFLTWERAKKQNIGIELNLLNNKIEITADLFEENRDNILASMGTVPTIVGASLPSYNLGKMKNSGFEGDISYRSEIGELKYWVKFNYTYAHNVIQYKDEVEQAYSYLNRTGQRSGQFFGFLSDGLYNSWEEVNDPNRPQIQDQNNRLQPGDIKYKDINGDGIINVEDQVPIGYSDFPEKVYGFSFGGSFKNFDFSVLFQGASNFSMNTSRRTNRGFFDQSAGGPELLNYSWSQEKYLNGEEILLPHLSVGNDNQKNNYASSDFWIRDASYMRLKNAEIGYTFRGGVLDRIGLGSARVYANGSNLFTWHNLFPGEDPELPDPVANEEPYPVTSTVNLGINVKF